MLRRRRQRRAAGSTCWLQVAEGMVCPRFFRLAFRFRLACFSLGPCFSVECVRVGGGCFCGSQQSKSGRGGRSGGRGAQDLPPLICPTGAGRAFGLGAWMGVVGCCDDDDDVRWAGCCWDHVLAAGCKCRGDGLPAFLSAGFSFSPCILFSWPVLSRRVRSCWRWMLLWIAVK